MKILWQVNMHLDLIRNPFLLLPKITDAYQLDTRIAWSFTYMHSLRISWRVALCSALPSH